MTKVVGALKSLFFQKLGLFVKFRIGQ